MEDDASILLDGKTLANLRVVDLKLELEKRGLSKSGSKKDLVKRLKQQLEFEKLCGERKSTGDCDLKLELDADTEQNEFVQQYLAQQQKIYAQQKEVKRRVELEEIQKSGDEKESCDSSKGDDDKTEDEAEIEPENQKVEAVTNDAVILLTSSKRAQDVKEEVFEVSEADRHPSVIKETKTQYAGIGGSGKGSEVHVQGEYTAEMRKPIAEVRDVEKDREKELSTAISSLLSVEKSQKEIGQPEDLSVAANSGAGDGVVTRTTHDDDREKDLATAVLSSLLGDQDVETEKNEAVPSRMELDVAQSTRVELDVVPSQIETDVVPPQMEPNVPSQMETDVVPAQMETDVVVPAQMVTDVVVPAQMETDVVPSQLETDVVPAQMETDVVPSQMETDIVPSQMETDVVPTRMKSKLVHSRMKTDMVPSQIESDMVPSQTESKVAITQLKTDEVPSQMESKVMPPSQLVSDVASFEFREAETSVGVGESSENGVQVAVFDSAEMNVDGAVDEKNGGQSDDVDASLDVRKTPVETGEITQAVEEEMSSKMDVTSVPYSLSEIQLPESPLNIVKSQSHSAKATESDEDVHSNGFDSKLKRSESGDLNGKKEPDDKTHLVKVSDVEHTKVLERDHSDNDTATDQIKLTKRSQKDHSDSESSTDNVKSKEQSRKDKSRKKKYDDSDGNRSPAKKSSDSSKRKKDRRNRSSSLEEGRHSRDRSKSPKKGSKSSRKDKSRRRSVSSEEGRRSKTKSKRSSPKKSSRERRRKRDRGNRSPSTEEDGGSTKDRSSKKGSKGGRSVSSEDERHSRTRSRESPKKEVTVDRHKKSANSGDERRSRTRSKESPKRETNVIRREGSVGSEEERSSKTQKEQSGEGTVAKKHSTFPETERRSRSKEITSQKEHSPETEARVLEDDQYSRTQSSEISPKKTSNILGTTKSGTDHKRRHSVDSDDDSKIQKSPVKKSKKVPSDAEPKTKDDEEKMDCRNTEDELQEKMDCQSVEEEQEKSQRDGSSRATSMSLRKDTGRSGSSRSRCPEKTSDNVALESLTGRPPSPKDVASESSREKDDSTETAPTKIDVSEGELASSREGSPMEVQSKWGRHSATRHRDSGLAKQSTITVIMKEAPKQKLKIKRDNVVVSKAVEDSKELYGDRQDTTEDSVVETPEPEENQKLEPGECSEVSPSTTYVSRKITLSSRKRTEEKTNDASVSKRSKWGNFAASRKAKQTVSISTDSLKTWFPDFKLLKEPVAELVPEEPPSPAPVKETIEVETPPLEKVTEEPKVTAVTRRLEPLVPTEEEKPKVVAADTQAEDGAEPTRILFVRNLVRPFTLLQLKELLKETGRTVDGKFWIDKIKSQCFVTYETEEEAIKTRSVLNNARWPMSNPKILAVDFATEQDLAFRLSGAVDRPMPLPSPPTRPPQEEPRDRKPFDREARLRDRVPVREWDEGKVRQDSPPPPDKSERTWGGNEEKSKGTDKDKKDPKRRVNEDTPAKLLDDLFQKTKATPCIYWLPLNEEQIKERAEQQRLVRAERDRRDQENKRPRSKQRMRETDTRRSSTRSRSPLPRRR